MGILDSVGNFMSPFDMVETIKKGAMDDVVRDTPAGDILEVETSPDKAASAQQDAINKALEHHKEMYRKAREVLDPIQEQGSAYLNKIIGGIESGEFDPGQFTYEGDIPEFKYTGYIPEFKYTGPEMVGSVDYEDAPIDASIASYLKDDPGLAWQQEQLTKAIDRSAAASGRWGGGATAREMSREHAGLLAQDYQNRFNRAAREREAQVRAEQERYGRVLTDTEMANLQAQDAFRRQQYGFETNRDREQEQYGRTVGEYGINRDREQEQYGRTVGEYGMEDQRLKDNLSTLQYIANLSPQMAIAIANTAMGHGSSIGDLNIQQGNVEAGRQMANTGSSPLGDLLGIAGDAAPYLAWF